MSGLQAYPMYPSCLCLLVVTLNSVADALADKLVRDSIIWTHLAGDATQRLKVMRRLAART